MAGWIKLHRCLTEHWVWDDKPFSKGQAWIDLLMMANHKDKKFSSGSDILTVEKGSVITSELKLMERWGWSKTKVRAFLQSLQNDEMLVKKTDRKKTTITIVNYSVFQDLETTEEPQKDHKKTDEEPIKNTNKNERKKEGKNNNINTMCEAEQLFEKVWAMYPCKKGKGQVSDAQKKRLLAVGEPALVKAIERYSSELQKDASWRKPQNGSTFFNSGYVDYLDGNFSPDKRQKETKKNNFNNFAQRDNTAIISQLEQMMGV